VSQFELTPKALANFSPWLERRDNHGITIHKDDGTLKGFGSGEPFQGLILNSDLFPGLSLRSNPGLKLANAFGVKFKLRHYQKLA
jgi:hypothetical protein